MSFNACRQTYPIKLAGTLELLIFFKVPINHNYTLDYLLKFSLSQLPLTSCAISSNGCELHLTNAIIKSELKHLNLSGVEIDLVMGNSLAQLLTQTTKLEVVKVIGECSVVKLMMELKP